MHITSYVLYYFIINNFIDAKLIKIITYNNDFYQNIILIKIVILLVSIH